MESNVNEGVSRRGFFHCAACATTAAGAAVLPMAGFANAANAAMRGKEVLHEFAYGAVQLTGTGRMKEHYDRIHSHYLALDNDRILKVFRQNAGLPAPGPDMGGWYDADGFVPGLAFGQYVSGIARYAATTNNAAAHAKVATLVEGFAETIIKAKSPYAGKGSQDNWAAYVMDKYVVALVDAYQLSGVTQAKDLLPIVIDKCLPYISPVSVDRIGKVDPPWDETYVLSENLFHVADITGDDKYRAMAVHYLLNKEWFDPLAAGQDVLPTKHAYSHTVALSSGAQAYRHLGDPKYRTALINAWKFMEPQRYASGGWGPEEQFVELGKGLLAESLKTSKAHFETPCGAFADMKLARYLTSFTGEAQYGDGLERMLYNTMLATRLPDSDGEYPYYSNYGPGGEKLYYHRKWPCCSGTLVQGVADYVRGLYFHDDDTLVVNMYASSQVKWDRSGGAVEVAQETNYPQTDAVRLTVRKAGNGRFTMKLRIPAWTKGATLAVNGQKQAVKPGTLAALSRTWKAGDTIDLVIPQPLRTLSIDDQNPNLAAVMRGAVMYVGVNPWDGIENQTIALPGALAPIPNQDQAYRAGVDGRDLVFVPYYAIDTERYNTYFKIA
ncbi:beta-L-arabinofuranosidase domain-containing protein [Hephaestia sp. GCM10023244]|uniref:beta-L-arabinofuranosidase domain-containing protein n=1 Tax=unclassified Hephaestia TaxID=2631281 RepID=UPI00207730B2|nr:beta-L-arabinofuranosidase domain-containing protein [Hephaestia sp. MAHUQ-44]MCM8730557.1 glycoside hydrolase family 127 protein [Hephaestia sp. MAHUQ-44]